MDSIWVYAELQDGAKITWLDDLEITISLANFRNQRQV
jgi:hypothetical protein